MAGAEDVCVGAEVAYVASVWAVLIAWESSAAHAVRDQAQQRMRVHQKRGV